MKKKDDLQQFPSGILMRTSLPTTATSNLGGESSTTNPRTTTTSREKKQNSNVVRIMKCFVPLIVVVMVECWRNPISLGNNNNNDKTTETNHAGSSSPTGTRTGMPQGLDLVTLRQQVPFPIPAPGYETTAGTCTCNHNDGRIRCMPKFHVIGVHKAGSKAIMNYLKYHRGLAGTRFIEDRGGWLTNKMPQSIVQRCDHDRKEEEDDRSRNNSMATKTSDRSSVVVQQMAAPIFIPNGKSSKNDARGITTCSFDDYTLLYGQYSDGNEDTCRRAQNNKYPLEGLDRPMFDELVIWEMTFSKPYGTPLTLPDLFYALQPSAYMLITVRNSIDVTYSAYNHFGAAIYGPEQGPDHFDSLIRELLHVWIDQHCTPVNFTECLPKDLILPGRWLSRSMYSKNIPAWLERFTCSQVHIFDVSMDPYTAVTRLYEVMGVPDPAVAKAVTACTYLLQQKGDNTTTATSNANHHGRHRRLGVRSRDSNSCNRGERGKNFMNKANYEPMMPTTRIYLEDFFAPYYQEVCDLMSQFPCLEVPLFLQHCPHNE